MNRVMYHTQESRFKRLIAPVICERDDAWLGEAHYFWNDLEDAIKWGDDSKKATGYHEVYKAKIDCKDVLDTVFNEEHYLFWKKQIEKVAKKIVKATSEKPTLKELNDYFKERGQWDNVSGILFQDLPENSNYLMVKPIRTTKRRDITFNYRKRIQLALYKLGIMSNFAFYRRYSCT